MSEPRPIPEVYGSVSANLAVHDAAAAVDFYQRALSATEIYRMPTPDGEAVLYSELDIGGTRVMLSGEMPGGTDWVSPTTLGGTSVSLYLYVGDVDDAFERAVEAGATVKVPVSDAFWGDRYGMVVDPFGHVWSIATRTTDMTPEEIQTAAKAFFAKMASQDG